MSDTGEARPEPALRVKFIIEDVKLFPSRDRGLYSQRSRVGTKKLQSMRTDQGPSTHQSVRQPDGPLRQVTPQGCRQHANACVGRNWPATDNPTYNLRVQWNLNLTRKAVLLRSHRLGIQAESHRPTRIRTRMISHQQSGECKFCIFCI